MTPDRLWALVLAGGDGKRLLPLTTRLTGTPTPKQFCRITGDRSPFESTLDRIAPLVPAARTLAVVTRSHLGIAGPQLAALPAGNVVVQPRNRETGPGLLLPLLTLAARAPDATVVVLPSDHFVRNAAAFRVHVARAARQVAKHPDRIALLGIVPEEPESGFGYVLPGRPHAGTAPVFDVARFVEKPSPAAAAMLVRCGALWNSFVMVFRAARLLELLRTFRPADVARLADAPDLGAAYETLPPWNFSYDFLRLVPEHLLLVRADGLGWSDWGTPDAVERTVTRLGLPAPWRNRAVPVYAAR